MNQRSHLLIRELWLNLGSQENRIKNIQDDGKTWASSRFQTANWTLQAEYTQNPAIWQIRDVSMQYSNNNVGTFPALELLEGTARFIQPSGEKALWKIYQIFEILYNFQSWSAKEVWRRKEYGESKATDYYKIWANTLQ